VFIDSVAQAAAGMAGAFTATQGAVALFGVESEELQETLVRLNAAMALSQGISGLLNAYKASKPLIATLKAQALVTDATTGATNKLGTALKGLGIGLLISAVVALVTNWEKIKTAMIETFPVLGNLTEKLDGLKQVAMGVGNVLKEFIVAPMKIMVALFTDGISGAIDQAKESFNALANYDEGVQAEITRQTTNRNQERLKMREETLNHEIALAKAKGEETIALERSLFSTRLALAAGNAEEIKKIQRESAVFEATVTKQRQDEALKAAEEQRKLVEETEAQRLELLKSANDVLTALQKERELSTLSAESRELFLLQEAFDEKLEVVRAAGLDETLVLEELEREKALISQRYRTEEAASAEEQRKKDEEAEKKATETKIALMLEEKEARLNNLSTVSSALNTFGGLLGEQTAAGKALGVASATIDTYVGANKALSASPPPFNFVAAAAVIASGLASVRKIIQTKVPKSRGSSGATSAPAPSAPNFGLNVPNLQAPAITTTRTQLSDTDRRILDRPIIARVVETDVSGTQRRVAGISRNAEF
jgi:hypothetical protein